MQSEQLIMEENGKRYRMLQVRESIEAGDQIKDSFQDSWRLFVIPSTPGISWIVGSDPSGWMPYGFYRRPIQ